LRRGFAGLENADGARGAGMGSSKGGGMKTLLQTMVDLLEAGGVHVSMINVFDPADEDEADKREPTVTLTVRGSKKITDDDLKDLKRGLINDFVRDCVIYDEKSYEWADVVYTVYKEYIENRSADLLAGKSLFFCRLKMQYPKIEFKNAISDNKPALFIYNIRLQKETFFNCTDGNCSTCDDTSTCPGSPENNEPPVASTDIQKDELTVAMEAVAEVDDLVYSPTEAIEQMLAGHTLIAPEGKTALKAYYKRDEGFIKKDDRGNRWFITDFTNLYSEASYAKIHDKS